MQSLEPSSPPAAPVLLDSPRRPTSPWYRLPAVWLAAALGFACGVAAATATLASLRDPDAPAPLPTAELRPVELTQPALQVAPPAEEPTSVPPPPAPAPLAAKPAPTPKPAPRPEVAAVSSLALAGNSTVSFSAIGLNIASGGIDADVYVDGQYVGRTPIAARPVAPGRHVVRFDCLWKGKAYRGPDTTLPLESNMDATLQHKCDATTWVGVPDEP